MGHELDRGPTIRLAHCGPPQSLIAGLGPAPTVRLAHKHHGQGQNVLMGIKGVNQIDALEAPALLVSYFYLEPFLKNRAKYCYRDWVMDSGAFSAHNSGATIDLQAYIDKCKELFQTDSTLTEVFSLDVIGDWRAGEKNTEKMWAQGVPAIPTYHVGEPAELLKHMAQAYPKLALGGAVGYRSKDAWAAQCFSRIWPKKIHGLGFGSITSILSLPWHSVDATNWEIGPCKFGRWQSFGKMSLRGSNQNLRSEVLFYLELERKARARWKKEMAKLETAGPTMRLVGNGNGGRQHARDAAFGPTLRLAADCGSASGQRIEAAIGKKAK